MDAAEHSQDPRTTDPRTTEDKAFWTRFLRVWSAGGLEGARLVISDAHVGLKEAIGKVLGGATWQRCRVHFMRTLLATLPKVHQQA